MSVLWKKSQPYLLNAHLFNFNTDCVFFFAWTITINRRHLDLADLFPSCLSFLELQKLAPSKFQYQSTGIEN